MNLPNALSFLRIFFVPAFIWLVLDGEMEEALWLFIIAGITDGLDGFIAKRFDMVTELGKYLDPVADKLLLLAGFIILSWVGMMPLWLTLMVVTRDLVIIAGAIIFQVVTGALRMEPLWISKVNTVVQIITLVLVLVRQVHGHDLVNGLADLFILAAGATTLISGLAYVFEWSRRAVQPQP